MPSLQTLQPDSCSLAPRVLLLPTAKHTRGYKRAALCFGTQRVLRQADGYKDLFAKHILNVHSM